MEENKYCINFFTKITLQINLACFFILIIIKLNFIGKFYSYLRQDTNYIKVFL